MELLDRVAYRLKLRDLRLLDTVVRLRSMAKAATQLNISQPAVSKAIAELEHMLGVRLVDRSRQGVEPTKSGRALLQGGVAMFDELRQAVKNIEFLADPAVGEVRIGCNLFLAASFVAAVVDRLSRRYPRVVFHVAAAPTETLHRDLHERNVDLLVTRSLEPIADDRLDYELLFEDNYVVAAGAQSPLVRRRRLKLADLVDEAWTLPPPENLMWSVLMDAFRAIGFDYPRATVVTGSPHMRMSLLTTGRFVTIFSASALMFPTKSPEFKVLPVELSKTRVQNGIVTLKNRTMSPTARLVIEHAREVAKPLTRRG